MRPFINSLWWWMLVGLEPASICVPAVQLCYSIIFCCVFFVAVFYDDRCKWDCNLQPSACNRHWHYVLYSVFVAVFYVIDLCNDSLLQHHLVDGKLL